MEICLQRYTGWFYSRDPNGLNEPKVDFLETKSLGAEHQRLLFK
jgi:hypothetical protein